MEQVTVKKEQSEPDVGSSTIKIETMFNVKEESVHDVGGTATCSCPHAERRLPEVAAGIADKAGHSGQYAQSPARPEIRSRTWYWYRRRKFREQRVGGYPNKVSYGAAKAHSPHCNMKKRFTFRKTPDQRNRITQKYRLHNWKKPTKYLYHFNKHGHGNRQPWPRKNQIRSTTEIAQSNRIHQQVSMPSAAPPKQSNLFHRRVTMPSAAPPNQSNVVHRRVTMPSAAPPKQSNLFHRRVTMPSAAPHMQSNLFHQRVTMPSAAPRMLSNLFHQRVTMPSAAPCMQSNLFHQRVSMPSSVPPKQSNLFHQRVTMPSAVPPKQSNLVHQRVTMPSAPPPKQSNLVHQRVTMPSAAPPKQSNLFHQRVTMPSAAPRMQSNNFPLQSPPPHSDCSLTEFMGAVSTMTRLFGDESWNTLQGLAENENHPSWSAVRRTSQNHHRAQSSQTHLREEPADEMEDGEIVDMNEQTRQSDQQPRAQTSNKNTNQAQSSFAGFTRNTSGMHNQAAARQEIQPASRLSQFVHSVNTLDRILKRNGAESIQPLFQITSRLENTFATPCTNCNCASTQNQSTESQQSHPVIDICSDHESKSGSDISDNGTAIRERNWWTFSPSQLRMSPKTEPDVDEVRAASADTVICGSALDPRRSCHS